MTRMNKNRKRKQKKDNEINNLELFYKIINYVR